MKHYIPIENKLSYVSIPRNKDLNYNIKNHCDFPSRSLVIDRNGECFICTCEAWLPISVGKIEDFDNLEEIWQTASAKAIQEDIIQKKFSYCAVDRCGILLKDQRIVEYAGNIPILDPDDFYYISINIDDSCNLICPSCRKESIMITHGEEHNLKIQRTYHLLSLLEKFDHQCHLTMTGNGDPLASSIMRPLIHQWRPRHNHSIRLFTNGLLLEKQLVDASIVNNISQYFISIDAGSESVYRKVRYPGNFKNLLTNLDFLSKLVSQTRSSVLLKFVLQKNNYNDMENFVELCNRYNFSGVINRLENWGTWDNFDDEDVIGNTKHELHDIAVENLKRVYFSNHQNIAFNPSLINICTNHE